jgi:hypothetical protein
MRLDPRRRLVIAGDQRIKIHSVHLIGLYISGANNRRSARAVFPVLSTVWPRNDDKRFALIPLFRCCFPTLLPIGLNRFAVP